MQEELLQNTSVVTEEENIDDLFKLVELDERESEHIAAEPYSYWKSVLRVFIKKPAAIISLVSLIILIIGVVFIPMFVPEGYLSEYENLAIKNQAPSIAHIWGTDLIGRDVFFLCWIGAGKSLGLALISSFIVLFIGTIFGLIWGFFKKLDRLFIEIYNLFVNIPSLLIYMLLSTIFSSAFPTLAVEVRLIVALTLTGWIGLARFVRNQVIIITNREYNVASQTLATPPHRIMFKNLLPFILSVIITDFSLTIPGMISSEVSMSYFGVGLPSTDISIGALLEVGRKNFTLYPWQLLYPALLLALIIFIFFLMGLALTDALDPKKHR